jgi:hypothetical protein
MKKEMRLNEEIERRIGAINDNGSKENQDYLIEIP